MRNCAGNANSSKWLCEKSIKRTSVNATGGPRAARALGRDCKRPSDVEALAAAALGLDVGIVELEAFVQSLAREVELGAVEIRQAFRIDDDGDAMTFEAQVLGLHVVGERELVRKPRATGGLDAQPQRDALAALRELRAYVARGFLGQRDRHVSPRRLFRQPRRQARQRAWPRQKRHAWPCSRPPPP